MKNLTRILAVLLALCLAAALIPAAFAATADAVIDPTKTGSLTIYKYDLTSAVADGVWGQESYVTTGVYDPDVTSTLADYAIKGVEFTYLKVAELKNHTAAGQVSLLYGFDSTDELLTILGLEATDRVSEADSGSTWYFTSDTLIDALAATLAANTTAAKNALEDYISISGTAMDTTDAEGKTQAKDLPLGLYLVVETGVPTMVTTTTNPFLVSIPMTSINGTNATNGGEAWLYDITIAAKNETGKPTLDKAVKENETQGFVGNVTATVGDTVSYKITSRLPIITNAATYISQYTITDTPAAGLTFAKDDVVLTFFEDSACSEQIAQWTADDETPKFTVSYTDAGVMTIELTAAGLEELNTSTAVWDNGVDSGYSGCYMTVTYAATLNSSAVLGDAGNKNEAILSWSRNGAAAEVETGNAYVHSYGVDLTKVFSDLKGNFANVNFVLRNSTDGLWIVAAQDADTGIWTVTGTAATEADATKLVPDTNGKITLRGLEADIYELTEVKTDNGYVLLEDSVPITISTTAGADGNLTAAALIGEIDAAMIADGASANALVTLTVVNNKGYDMPGTGETGTWILTTAGILLIASAAAVILLLSKTKKEENR